MVSFDFGLELKGLGLFSNKLLAWRLCYGLKKIDLEEQI